MKGYIPYASIPAQHARTRISSRTDKHNHTTPTWDIVSNIIEREVKLDELLGPADLSYLPYQREGIEYILQHRNTLLADEMGLGKTVQSIGVLNNDFNIRSALIVCPASLRFNWRHELKRWLRRNLIPSLFPESDRGEIWITSYEQLSKIENSQRFDCIILDEAHYIKSNDSLRNKQIKRICNFNPHAKRIFMTGSPIENYPIELWPLLQLLDPSTFDPPGFVKGRPVGPGMGAGYYKFARKYCGGHSITVYTKHGPRKSFEAKGATNLDDLNLKLKSSCMVRRLKKDVLKQLPPKRRELVVLEPPSGDTSFIHNEHEAFAKTGLDYNSDVEELTKVSILFEEYSRLRKESGLRKVPYVVSHVVNCLEATDKIIIFAHHKEVVWNIADELSNRSFKVVTLTGDHTEEMRNQSVRMFQEDPTCQVFIGTIQAAGVGLTLTAASHIVFAEMAWKDMSQAEDRAHRIGQEESLLIQYFVFDWSVDSNIARTVIRKMDIVERTLNQ